MYIAPAVNLTVDEGRNISFFCNSTTSPATVTWIAANKNSFENNVRQLPGGILHVSSAIGVNENEYICNLTNFAGSATAIARLAVTCMRLNNCAIVI